MSDIIERLRTHDQWPVDAHHDALEAADEIERLRKATTELSDETEQLCRKWDQLFIVKTELDREIERLRKYTDALRAELARAKQKVHSF